MTTKTTHLICVNLNILQDYFFLFGSGGCRSCMCFWAFLVQAISAWSVQKHQKATYDSKTGWAPIECLAWCASSTTEPIYRVHTKGVVRQHASKKDSVMGANAQKSNTNIFFENVFGQCSDPNDSEWETKFWVRLTRHQPPFNNSNQDQMFKILSVLKRLNKKTQKWLCKAKVLLNWHQRVIICSSI